MIPQPCGQKGPELEQPVQILPEKRLQPDIVFTRSGGRRGPGPDEQDADKKEQAPAQSRGEVPEEFGLNHAASLAI